MIAVLMLGWATVAALVLIARSEYRPRRSLT
jgi:hypothetical protein